MLRRNEIFDRLKVRLAELLHVEVGHDEIVFLVLLRDFSQVNIVLCLIQDKFIETICVFSNRHSHL